MYQPELIIEHLGIQEWPVDKRNEVVEIATFRIGNAITNQLSEQQFNEYQAIVDDNTHVIDAWLENNVPNYKDEPLFKEFESASADDDEMNNPAKLFASLAWMQKNVPNIQEVISRTLDEYKQELVQ